MKNDRTSRPILAFCHIEKAAGTSLIHILRRIFFLRYASVRPMHSRKQHYFTRRDLKTAKLLNPFLRAIGGHAVVPHGDLVENDASLQFITQVRDPVARAASQYRFRVNRMNFEADWRAFLDHPVATNFQVRKIAGRDDLDLAKNTIRERFLLAGTVENFDTFLVLLADRLDMPLHLFTYDVQNVGRTHQKLDMPSGFFTRLKEQNQLDQGLYDWVNAELVPELIAGYSGNFANDLESFQILQRSSDRPLVGPLIDSVYRNAYLKPVSGLIRMANGLPYLGSYAED